MEDAKISGWMFEDKLDICIISKGKLGEGYMGIPWTFVLQLLCKSEIILK